MKPTSLLICLATALLCDCTSKPEPAPQSPKLRVKRMPNLPAHASSRETRIRKAAQECSRIQLCCREKIHELSPDAVAEMRDILTRVQAVTHWGGLCATPGVTISIALLDSTSNTLTTLTNWEISDAAAPAAPYHSTLTLPSKNYQRFRELLKQSQE